MGSQEPSERVAPDYTASDGLDAAKLVRIGGTVLDPWQSDILDDWLGRTPSGKWAAPSAGGSVPRQNGKSLLIQARSEAGMLLYNEQVVYTAHLQKTATETFEEMRDFFEGPTLRRHVAEYIPGDPQKVLDKIWQLGDERFARGVPCKKGLKELLAALEDMGLPRIVASSSPRNMIEMNLQTTGTARYFHDVVSGTEVAHSKPAPDTFLVAAKKLHLDPHDCLVLEDSFNGVRAGRAAGCVTVMVPDLMQPTEEIAQLYDRKCEDLLEVRDLLIEGKL